MQSEHRSVDYSDPELQQDIALASRGSVNYLEALHLFYRQSHKIDLERIGSEARLAIEAYWKHLEFLERQYPIVRLHYQDDREACAAKLLELDHGRDKKHVVAAAELLIAASDSGEEPDLSEERIRIARHIIMLMSEERGLDKADPYREIKKALRDLDNSKISSDSYEQNAGS
jgi:hypothetical protein